MRLSEAVKLLADAGIESARHDARELFSFFSGFTQSEMLTSDVISDSAELYSAVMERAARVPLQYITGTVDFYRESYKVSRDCLIPRQDTEILVDYAVKNLPCGVRFLDICTGSGCIAVSVLKNTEKTSAVALDISEGALAIASQNALANGVDKRVGFLNTDALVYVPNERFYAILSNPPYVTDKEYEKLEKELYHEPKIALVAADSGLEFYKKIIKNCKSKLDKNGFFAFEIGSSQAQALEDIAKENGMTAEIIKDYSALDRVAVLRFA